MQIKFYNTLGHSKQNFTPLKPDEVSIYSCGPTVYDFVHIGNLRAYLFVDLLRRFLEFGPGQYHVKHIMNITDVGHLTSDADTGEDKVEAAAAREKKTAAEIAKFYTDYFFKTSGKLNILKPTTICLATDYIEQMIGLIKILEQKGFTYKISDGVYFDTAKFKDYGKLTNQDLGGLKAGTRVEPSPEKKNPIDFALWKFTPSGTRRQMEWDSPWGRGFPGWHLECSVIAHENLGDQFDIHTGGVDHIFPHHTNEIAQAEAAWGKIPARFWLHNEHLLFGERKMAKSAGTFLTLDDLEKKGFEPLAFRMLCLQTHYRSKLHFSFEALMSAQESLKIFRRAWQKSVGKPATEKLASFWLAMSDDLSSPVALASLFELIKAGKLGRSDLETADKVLGFGLDKEVVSAEIQKLLDERDSLRRDSRFDEADKIRQDIEAQSYMLEDTPDGTRVIKR